jgi:phosphoadenosine phosphosulfate reductase
MEGHLERARRAIDEQYGEGVGKVLLPSEKTIVMNKVSSLDAMYEIVVDGHIVGRLRFDIPKLGYTFLLSLEGARRVGTAAKRKWVSLKDGVLKYLKNGANLMLPGVLGCDSEIQTDDEVWIIDPDGQVVGAGIARMSGEEMAKEAKGFAVKVREVDDPKPPLMNQKLSNWDDAVRSNAEHLSTIEEEAATFIKRTAEKEASPVVVGFSGGKDSLVTYLLVEKALGQRPTLFFTDTGLELPETIEFINHFAESRGVDITGDVAGNRFWESVDVFGPPARDFRWCCKVLKLGPAAASIAERLGGKVLSFMGQRKLESFQRSVEPRVTENPWVPGQVSANPIQRWNALEVWLYIFREEEPFNPLYNQGYHRMGCYLCPASPLAEIESLKDTHPELYEAWNSKLNEWAQRLGLPHEWMEMGFWRWKKLPKGQMKLIEQLGLDIQPERPSPGKEIQLEVTQGIAPCTKSGFSLEGSFGSGIDLERLSKLLPIFGETRFSEELGALRVKARSESISIFSSGSVMIRGEDERRIELLAKKLERAVRRALLCQACGSCIPQCDEEALHLREGKIAVDEDKCINCLKCDNWPCPTYL